MRRLLKRAQRNLADHDAASSHVLSWQDFEFKRSEMTQLAAIHHVRDYHASHSLFITSNFYTVNCKQQNARKPFVLMRFSETQGSLMSAYSLL